MTIAISTEQRRARLGIRHHLAAAAPATDVVSLAAALVGLHATDPATPFLSARARLTGFEVDHLEEALYERQEVVKHLCMRRTMFVQATSLLPTVQAAVSDTVAATQRKRLEADLEKGGVTTDGARWLAGAEAATAAALESLGPSRGAELSRAVPELQTKLTYAPGKAYGGEVAVATRVLTIMAVEGHIRRGRPAGTWASSQHRWAPVARPTEGVDRDVARVDLVGRWLRAFGPATTVDITWWSGLGVRVVTKALAGLDVVEVDLDGTPGWALADDLEPVEAPGPWVALLPALDPTTMGWKGRGWYLGEHGPRLFDRNGNAGPTVWCDGRVVGGWAQRATGEVAVELFDDVGAEASAAVAREAEALERWMKPVTIRSRFPTPVEKELRD
jgi:hypothetical protein